MEYYLEYLRKSQIDKDYGSLSVLETLQRHEKILDEYCLHQKLNVVKVYKEVVSGESLSARPQMQALLEELQTGKYAGVICMDIDRLSRGSSFDSGYIMQILQVNGCKILTPAKTYDLSNTQDEQFTDLKFMFSRYELRTITNRLITGRRESSKEGKYVGAGVPYGYKKVKLQGDKGYTLEIVNNEARIVQLIFDMYVNQNMGYVNIYHKLNELNIDLSLDRVIDIVRNPIYAGKTYFSRTPSKKQFDNGELTKKRYRTNDFELYDGLHPAIIDYEMYQKASDIRATKNHTPINSNKTLQNPFATLLRCGNCGYPIQRVAPASNRKHEKPKYICTGKRKHTGCDCVSCSCDLVESAIVDKMQDWLHGYMIEIKQPKDEAVIDYDKIIEEHQIQIVKLKKQQDSLCELLETGVYTIDMFQKRNEVLQSKIDTIDNEINAMITLRFERTEQNKQLNELVPTTQHLLQSYSDLDVMTKNEIWKRVLEKVEYYRAGDNIEINVYPRLSSSSNSCIG